MRSQRRPAAEPRSNLPRRARSLASNKFGMDGARALAPALGNLVGTKELKCATNAVQQETLAQTTSAALAGSLTTASVRTGPARLRQRSRRWSC